MNIFPFGVQSILQGHNQEKSEEKAANSVSVYNPKEVKPEFYTLEQALAVKNLYGAQIKTTLPELQQEAQSYLDKRVELDEKIKEIKKETEPFAKQNYRITSWANALVEKSKAIYLEAKCYEGDAQTGYVETGTNKDGSSNYIYMKNGKVRRVLLNAKYIHGNYYAEHSFTYRGDKNKYMYYQKNPIISQGDTMQCDEEYYFLNGELQRYDKNVTALFGGDKLIDEIRMYKKGAIQSITQKLSDRKKVTKTEKQFFFNENGLSSYVENKVDSLKDGQTKGAVYNFSEGKLSQYIENSRWKDCKNNADLNMRFYDDELQQVIVDSEMSTSSFMTADKVFDYEDGFAQRARIGYERTSLGTESCGKAVYLGN